MKFFHFYDLPKNLDKKKLLNKMENKVLEPTEQVTTT